jgi:hypothetical protein
MVMGLGPGQAAERRMAEFKDPAPACLDEMAMMKPIPFYGSSVI